jgi:hypothetical protein
MLPTVSVSTSEPEVCAGDDVTFIATALSGATDAMTYTWDIAGMETTNTTNPYSPIPSTPGETTCPVLSCPVLSVGFTYG